MKKIIPITVIIVVALSVIVSLKQGKPMEKSGQEVTQTEKLVGENKINWKRVNQEKKLYQLSNTEVNSILQELGKHFPNQDDRLKALSILRLGTPYQLDCLGEGSGRDKDPIFRLDVTDCTTFVLTNVALLHSKTLEEAKNMMKYLNYRPRKDSETGKLSYKITFENRLHFTTDRNETSPYFEDITQEIVSKYKTVSQRVLLNKIKTDGKRLININWEKEITINYIPSKFINKELLKSFPKTLGIAFVKKGDDKIGLDVRHEGFLFDGKTFFHASSIQKKVVAEDFLKYYFPKKDNPRFDGIILFKIK